MCESMGLLCSAHVDGSLILRILPAMDQRDFTVPIESSNITTLTSKVATIKVGLSTWGPVALLSLWISVN